MAVQLETREVQVERINGNGFKADGAWFNFSKFAKPSDVAMPSVGERVTVSLDKAGFVRRVAAVTAPASVTPETPTGSIAAPVIIQDDRGIVITRLAVLNTATAILSSGGGASTPEEVLELAGRLEVWATR